jgi:hypothetical protein
MCFVALVLLRRSDTRYALTMKIYSVLLGMVFCMACSSGEPPTSLDAGGSADARMMNIDGSSMQICATGPMFCCVGGALMSSSCDGFSKRRTCPMGIETFTPMCATDGGVGN